MSTDDLGLATRIDPRRSRVPNRARLRSTRRKTSAFVNTWFSVGASLIDGVAIVLSALCAGILYNALFYDTASVAGTFTRLGLFIATLFVVVSMLRDEYELSSYLAFAGHARRVFIVWNIAFLTALVFIFATKQTLQYSRVSAVLFYGVGLFALIGTRAVLVAKVKTSAIIGRISAQRVVLVGREDELREFTTRYTPSIFGVDVVASFVLRGEVTLAEDIALARASARVLRPDDIFILLPLSETEAIDACVTAFMKVPASIHIGPQRVLDRFTSTSVSRIGKVYSLTIVRRPLTASEVILKRGFDLMVAIPLLICSTPLLCLIGLAIKLDSHGPVLFVQRRYGFNQETFQILKFRSMTVTEDDRHLSQAARNDPRVTRVGRFLRRYNIDELPQLLNVVRGEMSLVGPRPHALVHNHHYERSIADYARRHNVKPGITGWAQIHGLRGEVTSEGVMRQRVEHDLFYIDNWSIGLDLRILAMTLMTRKAFENAF